MAVNDLITFRKGIASQWTSVNPVLASGEPGYDLTNGVLKIGDGVSNWVALSGIGSSSVGGSSYVGVRGIISTTGNLSSFSVSGGYPVGYLDLFQDGVKLVSTLDFSATDGSNVTLSNSVPSGTVLEYLTMASGVSAGGSSSLPSNISGSLSVVGDDYWGSVSILLTGEGITTDSSPTPKTVTSYGNIAANGSAKYGTGALTFPSDGSYLIVQGNSGFSFPGDFTLETWVKFTSLPSVYNGGYGANIMSTYPGAGANAGWQFRINGTSSGYDTVNIYTGTTDLNWSYAFSLNTWYHVAITRSGSSMKVFVNGSQVGSSVTNSDDMSPTNNNNLWIGRLNLSTYEFQLYGLLDDLRITKGVARYTSNFTAPSASLQTFASYSLSSVSLSVSGSSGSSSGLSWSSVPASSTASGTTGSIAYDDSYLYIATATNTWKRATLSTWVPFAPTSVTGLQMWLDASDASSLYDATTGGSLVAADGAVARWQDKSASAIHATQATSGSRPLRKINAQNGLSVIRMDGSDDYFEIPSTNLATDFTMFWAFKPNAANYALLATTSSGGARFMVIGTTLYNDYYGSGASTIATTATTGTGILRTYRRSSGTLESWLGGVSQGTVGFGNTLNGHTQIGRIHDQSTYNLSGDFYEVLIYSSAVSDADRTALESYLMSKWGIA